MARRLNLILVIVAILFLLIYFHIYFNTDFRHILISTNADSKKADFGLDWRQILNGPLEQNQSDLLTYISRVVLQPPAHADLPYNLTFPANTDTSMGQTQLILRALNNLDITITPPGVIAELFPPLNLGNFFAFFDGAGIFRTHVKFDSVRKLEGSISQAAIAFKHNGFFVECGAWDGETRSNTLLLETQFGWQGLLVEADPVNFDLLKSKHRKAWSGNCCLSIKPYPHIATFVQAAGHGRISTAGTSRETTEVNLTQVQCFPLFSLISAMNVTEVDYLSLDVEGSELDVLNTIPEYFLRRIRSLSVEYVHDNGGRSSVKKWMSMNGFSVFGEVVHPNNLANDFIFVNTRNIDSILLKQLQSKDSTNSLQNKQKIL